MSFHCVTCSPNVESSSAHVPPDSEPWQPTRNWENHLPPQFILCFPRAHKPIGENVRGARHLVDFAANPLQPNIEKNCGWTIRHLPITWGMGPFSAPPGRALASAPGKHASADQFELSPTSALHPKQNMCLIPVDGEPTRKNEVPRDPSKYQNIPSTPTPPRSNK